MTLSETTKTAIGKAFATRGKAKGKLLARCPASHTLEAAAWQGAMLCVNPYKASIGSIMFFSEEQRVVYNETMSFFESLPRDRLLVTDRDREALEAWGAW